MTQVATKRNVVVAIVLAMLLAYPVYSQIVWGGIWMPDSDAGPDNGYWFITAPAEVRAAQYGHEHVVLPGENEHGSKVVAAAGSTGVLIYNNKHSRVCDNWANGEAAQQHVWRVSPVRKDAWTYDSNGANNGQCGNETIGFSGKKHQTFEANNYGGGSGISSH